MELVKGIPITEFCDQNRLTPRERLELFIPVCQAVQHAHQKGVIHRDIKPSNVLVTMYDDKPVPKVIDLGVAKAIAQTGEDLLTLKGDNRRVVSVAFSPDGKRLAIGKYAATFQGVRGEVTVCDAQTGRELLTLKETAAVRGVVSQ